MTRPWTGFVAILALVLCIEPFAQRSLGDTVPQRVALDDVLTAYVAGDFDIVKRTFAKSLDFQRRLRVDRPRELDRWLGQWDRGKALLLLEFARTSATVAPQYVYVIVAAGRRYFALTYVPSVETHDFARDWHRAAVGLLQGISGSDHVENHLIDLPADPRLLLARAIAQERRCWTYRPSLDQPTIRVDKLLQTAGVRVRDDTRGPLKSDREEFLAKHSACLRETLSRFEAAVRLEDVAAEALVRGGWTLLQDGRPKEALEWLDAAKPRDDRDLEYWHHLFRGRALDTLARTQDAVDAYKAALALYPHAQSAGVGLAIALMRLDRGAEADQVARSIREGGGDASDPWLHYPRGDDRFAGRWIDSLRTTVR